MSRCLAFAMLCGAITCLAEVASVRGDQWPLADVASAVASDAIAQKSESPPHRMGFQRIHVPADRTEDWPLGGRRYLPMSRDEFERLVGAGDAVAKDAGPRVAEAEFRGALNDEGFLEGTASLRIEASDGAPAFLPLPVGRLVVKNVRWREPGRTTTFGAADRSASGVLVEASGWLEWDWTLKRRSTVNSDDAFDFSFPSSATTALVLNLPVDTTADCEGGILVSTAPDSKDRMTWRFTLGGRPKAVVRLSWAERNVTSDHRPEVQESLVYHFSRRGVEVEASLRLDAVTRPLRRVSLSLDPGLTIVAASLGQTLARWSLAANGNDGSTRVVVELPEPVSTSGQILHLSAWSPLVSDRPWVLPRIRPIDLFWRQGDATLLIPSELRLAGLREIDCRQSRLGRFPGENGGEAPEFQYFSPDSTVEVILSESRTPVRFDSATHIELNESETIGTVAAVFKATEGKVFELEANVEHPWVVDSVTATPAGRLKDWRLEQGEKQRDRLVLRLAKPLSSAGDSVRIEFATRRLESPLGRVLGINELTPIRFPTGIPGKRLATIRSSSPHVLATCGDESLRRIAFGDPDADTRALLPDGWDGLMFEHDSNAESLRVELRRERPGYDAEIEAEATVWGETMLESYRFRCVPKLSRMEHVVVRFSDTRDAAPRWSLGEEEGHPLSARRLTDAEQEAAGMVPGPETWRISLVPSRGDPFDIRAARTIPFRQETAVSLASLPEADSQSAVLTVRAVEGLAPRIINRRLEPIPTVPAPPGEYQTIRGTFRYDPTRVAQSFRNGLISIAPTQPIESQTPAVCWSRRIDSRFEEGGGSRHVATYYLENLGRPTIEVLFPASKREPRIREVWIDGRAASWRPEEEGESLDKLLSIDLPPGRRFVVVQIDFSTDSPGLGFLGSVAPPEPSINVPVPTSRWLVWLPPSHRLLDTGAGIEDIPADRVGWRERLFGPLGRPSHASPFDPRSLDDWKRLTPWGASEPSEREPNGLLEAIGRLPEARASGNGSAITVRDLLTGQAVRDVGWSLLVDEPALSIAGVLPSTRVRLSAADARTRPAITWLRRAGLAFLLLDDVAVLTSSLRVSLLQEHLEPTESSLTWRVLPGSLESSLRAAVAGLGDQPWKDVAAWRRRPLRDASPWHNFDQLPWVARDTRGWSAHCVELDGSRPVRLRVVHHAALAIIRWTAFFAAIGLGLWQGIVRPRVLAGTAAVIAVFVFLLPAIPAVAASGALLGTLSCLAVALYRVWTRAEAVSEPQTRSGASARTRVAHDMTRTLLVLAVAISTVGWRATLFAGEQDSPDAPLGVLIPVDKNRRPTGEKVFVPETLYRQLTQRGAMTDAPGWLIETAAYRGELRWDGSPKRLVPGEMRAEFRIRVLSSPRSIRIPFSRDRVTMPPEWAFLDGEVVRPDWESGDEAFLLPVSSEGYHRLEVIFTPTEAGSYSTASKEAASQEAASRADASTEAASREDVSRENGGFAVRIPAVPQSRLELSLPGNAPVVESPSALGEVTVDQHRLSALLGAADELRVRWRGDVRGPDGDAPAEVDELLMMSVTPGSISLEARFRVRVLHGRVGTITLNVDPRLELVGRPSIGRIETVPGSPGQLRAVLPSPQSEDFTYRIRFSLRDLSGVGRHRLPWVGVDGLRVAGRWFAVSVDDALEWSETVAVGPRQADPGSEDAESFDEQVVADDGPSALEQVAVPDFLAIWGDADVSPRLAYRCLGGSPGWSIATRPRRLRTVVDQRLTASVGSNRTTIRYEAWLGRTPGHGFHYRLLIPPSLTIDSLEVRESDADARARWSRSEDGALDVFLPGPAAARRRLIFEGRMETPSDGVFELPIPTVVGAYQQSCHVTLFRQASVLLELDRYEGLGEAEPEVLAADRADLGYLFLSMVNSGNRPPRLWLHVAPNQPETAVRQTTHVECRADKWSARTQFEIETRGGSADELRVVFPANLQGPISITPAIQSTSTTLSDGRKELTVRFGPSLLDRREFSLTMPLSDESPAVPDIAVRGAQSSERRVILPRRASDRSLRWDVQRLERISSTPEAITYRVVDDGFRAVLIPSGVAGRGARVRLAEIQLAWRDDGILHGVSTFDVEPSGRSWLPLIVPEGYELVQAFVDGVMAAPEPDQNGQVEDEKGRFRLPMGPPSLPCRVTVVFRGPIRDRLAGSSFTFPVPRLGDLPVEKSTWVVAGPRSREHLARNPTPRHELDVVRADSLARLSQLAARSKASPSDKRRWSHSRHGRFIGLEAAMEEHIASSPTGETRRRLEESLESLRRQWTLLEKSGDEPTPFRVGTVALSEYAAPLGVGPVAPSDDDTAGLFRQDFLGRHEATVYRAVTAGCEPLTVRYQSREPSWTRRTMPGLLLLVLSVAIACLAVRRGAHLAVMNFWPEALVIVVGLAWWLWLWPSFLGLVVVLAGFWHTVRRLWSKRRKPSSVVVSAE